MDCEKCGMPKHTVTNHPTAIGEEVVVHIVTDRIECDPSVIRARAQ